MWYWYAMFFVYVFPLFISDLGVYHSEPLEATLYLALGIIFWVAYITKLFLDMRKNAQTIDKAKELLKKGTLVPAIIIESDIKKYKNYNKISAVFEFKNFVGTKVKSVYPFIDSKPQEHRFEEGKTIYLRLDPTPNTEIPFIIEGSQVGAKKTKGLGLLIFTILYCVIVFLILHNKYSDGYGWRWLSLTNPWVVSPVIGLLTTIFFKKLEKVGTTMSLKEEAQLLLYGKSALGEITQSLQTGTYINEQPEMRLRVRYQDENGNIHRVEKKKVVLLNEMHLMQKGTIVELLYLPENPELIRMH